MRTVVQRVSRAAVRVDGQVISEIGRGLLVLLGIGKTDTPAAADWLIQKLLALRIFPDDTGKMNRSVTDIGGSLLIVSQFTLYGTLEKGTRPSFSDAMPPAEAETLYRQFMVKLRAATSLSVAEGRFAAMMDVELVNDGPVTIILNSPGKNESGVSAHQVGQASRLSPSEAERSFVYSNLPSPTATGGTPVPLFTAFDPRSAVEITHRRLPHWRQAGCTYFLTFRLADSLPEEKLRQWRAERDQWLRQRPQPATAAEQATAEQQLLERIQQWLDAGHGACWLRQSAVAETVEQGLRRFDGQRYLLGAFVIMPNHLHVLVTPLVNYDLAEILHSWKSYTAHQINRILRRSGPVWQDESFDHLVRNEQALARLEEYVRQNPLMARLNGGDYRFGVGQASRLSPSDLPQAPGHSNLPSPTATGGTPVPPDQKPHA